MSIINNTRRSRRTESSPSRRYPPNVTSSIDIGFPSSAINTNYYYTNINQLFYGNQERFDGVREEYFSRINRDQKAIEYITSNTGEYQVLKEDNFE